MFSNYLTAYTKGSFNQSEFNTSTSEYPLNADVSIIFNINYFKDGYNI